MEQFGRFLDSMEDNSLKMKAKFLDHCNKMSGRELNLYVCKIQFVVPHTCTCTNVHVCVHNTFYTCTVCIHVHVYCKTSCNVHVHLLHKTNMFIFASIVLKCLSYLHVHVHVTTTVNFIGTAIGKLPFVVIFTSTFYYQLSIVK